MTTVAGMALLLRQDLRRDRFLVSAWLAVLALMAYASAAATESLFGSVAERLRIATELNEQPGLVALYGPIVEPHSLGELAMSKLTVLYALVSSILYVVLVRRHTRVEEESGRAELAGGTAIGRDAPLAAVAAECGLVATALGLLVSLAAIAGGLPVVGSMWFGVTWIGTGAVGTGVAAVACQLSASARTCASAAAGLLAGAFAVRAVGDAVDGLQWLSWLSPLGWNTQLHAWADPRAWVAGLYVALSAALLALAQLLRGRRDLGAGFISARPGPTTGAIGGPWRLSWRLHRTPLLLWTAGTAAMGGLFGAMTPGFDDLLGGSGGRELVDRLGDTFIGALLLVAAIVVTCFAVSVIGHAHADELAGRSGLVLSTATSRARWFAAVAATAGGGAAWLLMVCGAALSVGYGAAGGVDASTAVAGALGWIPAVWVVAGLALIGYALGVGWVGWACYLIVVVTTLVGDLLELPQWLVQLSPYALVPAYPAEPWTWAPALGLVAVTVVAGCGSAWLFARRDLA